MSGSTRVTSERDPRNPFDSGVNPGGSVGADMKIGIGSNLTLEATINPDFGQVEADPAEVNLTVFETIFDEKRPFFIEGNNILEAGTSNYYYSRRIGARPTHSDDRALRRLSRRQHDPRRREADGTLPERAVGRFPGRGDERRDSQAGRPVRLPVRTVGGAAHGVGSQPR